jgi:predicted amidophosphoribosyltransferase
MSLKHGDRLDLVHGLATWMVGAAADIRHPDAVIVPVPIHRTRPLKRRYNQAAELGRAMAQIWKCDHIPDLLIRTRATDRLFTLNLVLQEYPIQKSH